MENSTQDQVSAIVAEIDTTGTVPTATSIQVAARFGKRHDVVLRAIRNANCSEKFRLHNFAESVYTNEQGKQQPCYLMTKDGFSFVAMGFTGKEAGQWKEAYIEAFNQMTEALERYVSFGVPADLYAKAMEAEKREAGSFARASVAGRALSLRRKEKKAFQGIVAMVRAEVQLQLLLGQVSA